MKRNNIYLLVLMLAFGLGIGACTQVSEDDTPLPPPPTEEGFLSFRMGIPAPKTTRSTDPGTAEEWAVDKVWVLLYGREGSIAGKLLYAYDLDVSNRQTPGFGHADNNGMVAMDPLPTQHEPDQYSFVTVAQQVDKRPYWMVIIANPGYYARTYGGYLTKFTNKGDGKLNASDKFYTLAGLQKANGDDAISQIDLFENDGSHFYYYENYYGDIFIDGFFMSNANGLVPVSSSDVKSSADEAQLNPVAVGIDRAVAQVIVSAGSASTSQTTTGGLVTSLTWGLKNINKKSYLYRNYAPLFAPANAAGKYLGSATSEQDYATSIAADRKFMYATDPNFGKDEQLAADFWDLDLDAYKPWNAYNATEETEFFYVTENTLSLEAQQEYINPVDPVFPGPFEPNNSRGMMMTRSADEGRWPYVTQVGIRAIIAYSFDQPSPTGSYYTFSYQKNNGYGDIVHRVFTLDEAKMWLTDGSGSVPQEMSRNLFWSILTASSFFQGAVDDLTEPIEESKDADGFTHVIQDDQKTISFHPGGLNEYVIPIKHFNFSPDYATSAETYGFFGVVRNNVYRVKINSITGPGIPNEYAGTYISAYITINPWYERIEQGEDL